MGVEWIRETSRDAEYGGEKGGEFTATRSWVAKTSSPADSPASVAGAAGISTGDAYPDDPDLKASRFRVRSSDSSGLLWTLTWEYKQDPAADDENQDPNNPDQPDQPDDIPGKPSVWGGSSSVVTVPIYKDRHGDVITNSAGDPLEDVTAEQAEERLTLTRSYNSHEKWMAEAKRYTNAINDAAWNGGDPGTWKCQGCSKKLNIEKDEQGQLIYWEVTWDFAWRRDGWQPKPWDIGFHGLAGDDGVFTPGGTKRASIKGVDNKPVRQPVALDGAGGPLPPGEPPITVDVDWYPAEDFKEAFGEVFTPGL